MAINLFDFQFPKPKDFTKNELDDYYQKIQRANPNISLATSIKISREMLQTFHSLMCQVIYYYPESGLGIEVIHEEGHVFKVRFLENSPAKEKGIHGFSFSVNAFDNQDIVRRHQEFDYNVSCVLNDKDVKIFSDPSFGYNYYKIVNHKNLKECVKLVFEEMDKVFSQSQVSTRKEQISEMVDHAMTLQPYTNFL